jgi:hypothetical protein
MARSPTKKPVSKTKKTNRKITKTPEKANKKPGKATGTTAMWSIKGIEHETRSKATTAAKRNKETIGKWANRVMMDAAVRELSSKKQVALPDPIDLMEKFQSTTEKLEAKIDALAEHQNKPLLKRVFG